MPRLYYRNMQNLTPLRIKRLEYGLSLDDVVEQTGISKSALSRFETDKSVPRREDARILFEFYNKEIPLRQIYDPFYKVGL